MGTETSGKHGDRRGDSESYCLKLWLSSNVGHPTLGNVSAVPGFRPRVSGMNGVKKQHKNSEASLSAGLAPEFRRTRGDKLVFLDCGARNRFSRRSRQNRVCYYNVCEYLNAMIDARDQFHKPSTW